MNPFERIIAPFNTHATSLAGSGIIAAVASRLYHDVWDAGWMAGLMRALFAHAATVDHTPLYELASLGVCFVMGCIALYIGAPWFVGKAPGPPPPGLATPAPADIVLPIQKAA